MLRALRSWVPLAVLVVAVGAAAGAGTAMASSSSTSLYARVQRNHLAAIHSLFSTAQIAELPPAKRAALLAPITPTPPPPSSAPLPCGGTTHCYMVRITTGAQAPWAQQTFRVVNQYFGTFSGDHLVIYAGQRRYTTDVRIPPGASAPPPEGGVRVMYTPTTALPGLGTGSAATTAAHVEQYLLPTYSGWLKITGVTGYTVSLVEEDGSPVVLNIATGSYSP